MEPSSTVVIALLVILAAIVLFSLFKGVIKMILLAMAAIGAIGSWIFIQRNGFTLLSCVTDSPQPWMVQVFAWGAGIFIFAIFFHGMSWFSQLFSWRRNGASTGGILTTVLMCSLMLWVGMVGISYYGDVSRISHFHDLAQAHTHGQGAPDMPWVTRLKQLLREAPATAWLARIDPMDDTAQTNLACLVAYGCSLNEDQMQMFYKRDLENCGVPHPSRFLDLFRDKGLRTLVEEGRFVTLLENEHLKTFLQRQNTQEILSQLL
ncbi:MAG: hypothetical protein J1E42_09280 [Akkermansiaceae bacterium]|nr:hypothetical protein [Akkermansiaceae bacterium]